MSIKSELVSAIELANDWSKGSYQPKAELEGSLVMSVLDAHNALSRQIILPLESPEQIIYLGSVIFLVSAFSDAPTYFSAPIESPTLVQLFTAFNEGLESTDEKAHIYLEEMIVVNNPEDYFSGQLIDDYPYACGSVFIHLMAGS